MLSSIHPLGERARHNRWGLTVGAFTVASTMTGAVVGTGLGWVGSLLVGSIEETSLLLGTAVLALTAGALDLIRVRPPGPERQVNEAWIGHYRGWVYGGAFGVELGIGVMTFVVTWGVYATYGAQLLSASPWRGAVVGGVFGFGRSLALLVARRIDRPSILTDFHRRMADLGLPVRRGTALSLAVAGVLGTIGAIL
jgi:hypothetical protein